MDTIQKANYEKLLYTMINDYGIKDITNERQRKNGTTAFETASGERFQIYKSGYIRRTVSNYFFGKMVYQINPTMKSIYPYVILRNGKLEKVVNESTVRLKIFGELAKLTYLFNFLVKNKYIEKQTNKLNAEIKI